MVLVASRAADSTVMRAEQTKDADLVVDLCARPSLLRDIAYHLGTLGFDQLPPFPGRGFARCTFATATGQIDLLAPMTPVRNCSQSVRRARPWRFRADAGPSKWARTFDSPTTRTSLTLNSASLSCPAPLS